MNPNRKELTFQSIDGNSFKFQCHKEIECFTKCCAKLNLLLTPYDILRLKNHLKTSSSDFLDKYTDMRIDERSRYPMIYLNMNKDNNDKCPFLSLDGCQVYEDRPSACRIYPIGRASTKPSDTKDAKEQFFIVTEEHCLGFKEEKKWAISEWMANEGLIEYNRMNDKWMEIITAQKSLGDETNITQKIRMFNMASYNLDQFRDFLFKSPFFLKFQVDQDQQKKLVSDDKELMLFAFNWLRFSLFGEKTMRIIQ